MTRQLNIVIDEIVLHGDGGSRDPAALERDISDALAGRLAGARSERYRGPGGTAAQVADRILAALPAGGDGDGGQ